MALYEKYKKLNIDGSRIGLERGSEIGGYFCTPKGARVIGWDNGIHYCFIRGYGEMVFAVNPETGADKYVYPLAESFEDFLRLILACGHTAPVEQIIMWTEEQFKEFLTSDYNAFMQGQQEVLDTITEKLKLEPMAAPYQYVKQLQAQFDDSKIKLVIYKRGFQSLRFSYMMKGTGLTEFQVGTPRPSINVLATLHHSAFDLASWDRMLLPFYAPI